MAAQSRLIAAGVNYYLEGKGSYTGSATPWTTNGGTSGSPYTYAMNDTTGKRYTAQASQRQEVYGGGPPFRNGQTLIYDSYGNVAEQITIQCKANSHDNAVFLLQQLRRILNTALFTLPCVFAFQPDGATNAVYYEIYGADVQEDERFTNDEVKAANAGHALVRAIVTWRRSPHGTLITTGETALSALTFTNTGTGANNNTQAFTAGISGDLIAEGQPMNISIFPTSAAAAAIHRTWLGSVLNRTYATTGAGALSTSSTTEVSLVALSPWTVTSHLTNNGIKPRIMLRFSTAPTSNLLMRLSVFITGSVVDTYSTPWVSATDPVFPEQDQLVDFGTFPADLFRQNGIVTAPTISISLMGRSTNGSPATATLGYSEYIWYYDWARIDTATNYTADGSDKLYVDAYQEVSGLPCVPWPNPEAFAADTSTGFLARGSVRGRLPRYFSGASLYLAWVNATGAHTTTHTATVSARVSPQWSSLRGSD